MAADTDYADLLDRLAASHQQRLANALIELEKQIADLMTTAPLRDGALFDLEWALSARTDIRRLLDEQFLAEVQETIKDYRKVANSTLTMLRKYGDFTQVDASVVTQLQRLSFQGFEAIANEYLDILATEVYQNTLTGRALSESIENLRGSINGIYKQSDSVEANRLVALAANGTEKQKEDAVKKLQTLFGRDRLGRNLKRYSTQMMQDSLMQFSASINTAIGNESGATKWKYYGSNIEDTREFCRKRSGKTFTLDEIEKEWSGTWKGKAPGDPFIVRGGYNCRHHFRPIFEE
tara:strand:- start:497 stop:1375 length:879 start_codon:yes stop_codon:yes gene_type:complete